MTRPNKQNYHATIYNFFLKTCLNPKPGRRQPRANVLDQYISVNLIQLYDSPLDYRIHDEKLNMTSILYVSEMRLKNRLIYTPDFGFLNNKVKRLHHDLLHYHHYNQVNPHNRVIHFLTNHRKYREVLNKIQLNIILNNC